MPFIFSRVFDYPSSQDWEVWVAWVTWEVADKPFGLFTALCQPCFEREVGLDEVSPNTNYSIIKQKLLQYQIKG